MTLTNDLNPASHYNTAMMLAKELYRAGYDLKNIQTIGLILVGLTVSDVHVEQIEADDE